jgi:hypothetical protein
MRLAYVDFNIIRQFSYIGSYPASELDMLPVAPRGDSRNSMPPCFILLENYAEQPYKS